jgi:hypothetical protein
VVWVGKTYPTEAGLETPPSVAAILNVQAALGMYCVRTVSGYGLMNITIIIVWAVWPVTQSILLKNRLLLNVNNRDLGISELTSCYFSTLTYPLSQRTFLF